jgi:hypothetical protein
MKIRNIAVIALVLGSGLLAQQASAQFQLMDDLTAQPTSTTLGGLTASDGSTWTSVGTANAVAIATSSSSNTVNCAVLQNNLDGADWLPLATPIAATSTGATVFFQWDFGNPLGLGANNLNWSVENLGTSTDAGGANSGNVCELNANVPNRAGIEIRNGGGFVPFYPSSGALSGQEFLPENNVRYECWMVINNNAKTFQVYMAGGTLSPLGYPILMNLGSASGSPTGALRNTSVAAISDFIFGAGGSGNAGLQGLYNVYEDTNGSDLIDAAYPVPPVVTSVTATAGQTSVAVTWNTDPGTPSAGSHTNITYTIVRTTSSTTNTIAGITGTNYDDTGLSSIAYTYVVYAVNSGFTTSAVSTSATATPTGAPPSVPQNVAAAATPTPSVTLNWYASSGNSTPITYNINRSTTSGGETFLINVSSTNYTDLAVANDTVYYYTISAVGNNGATSAPSSEVIGAPPGPPAAPTGVTATAGSAKVVLTWNAVSGPSQLGAITYNIGRSTTPGGEVIIYTNISSTNYTDLAVTINQNTYYYVIYAVNLGGMSAASSEAHATPGGPQPVLNFDVPGGEPAGINFSGLGVYTDTNALGGTNGYWNPIVVNGTTPTSTNSDGVSLNVITFTEAQFNLYSAPTNDYTPTPGTPGFLDYYYADSGIGTGDIETNSLNNVPAGTYALYLYGKDDDGTQNADDNGSTTFTVSVVSGGVTNTNYSSLSTTNGPDTNVFVLNNDYVVFYDVVVPNGGGMIVFTYTKNAAVSGNNEGSFNGVQLTPFIIQPPTIVTSPTSEELFAGATAVFTTTAAGGDLNYQWYTTNNVGAPSATNQVTGATNATLTITNVQAANATNYYCVVTNNNTSGYQVTNTSAATLTIITPAAGTFEAGAAALGPLHYYGFNDINNPSASPSAATAVAYDYAGGDNGLYQTNCQNGFDGIHGPLPSDGFPGFPANNYAVSLLNEDELCNVAVDSPWNLNTNTVTITAWINPASTVQNDGTLGAVIVMNRGSGSDIESLNYIVNTTNLNVDLGYIWNNDTNTSSWDSGLQAPANQWSFVTLVVTPTNATISVMNTSGVQSSTFTNTHANAAFAGTTTIGDTSNPAYENPVNNNNEGVETFYGVIDEVGIFNQALTQTQLGTLFAGATLIPVFAQQPMPATLSLYPGQTAQFTTVVAAATSYQWWFTNLSNVGTALANSGTISGAKSNILTISGVVASNEGTYVLVVSDTGGVVTSSNAVLTILPAGPATNITMSVAETTVQDWNTGANWSDGNPASVSCYAEPGSTYIVEPGGMLRTPNVATNIIFPGIKLVITNGARLFLEHSANTNISIDFTNLQLLNGSSLDNGAIGEVTVTGALGASGNVTISDGDSPTVGIINFDVPGGVSGDVNYSGQGALSDPNDDYWNAVNTNTPFTTAAGFLSDGITSSPITLTAPYGAVYTGDAQGANGTPSGLFAPFEDIKTSLFETNTLNNVPAGTYNLYLYGNNGLADNADRGTTLTVSNDVTAPISLSTANVSNDYNTFVLDVNYVEFTNITVSAAGYISIVWTANAAVNNTNIGGTNTEGIFNGLQLQQLTAVAPPPPGPRPLNIASSLSGNGTITYSSGSTNDLILTGTGNTFSGPWVVAQGTLLGIGANSLGTNNITVDAAGALETAYNVDDTTAGLVLNGQMFLHQSNTFYTVKVNGVMLSPGTYSFASLNGTYPAYFPATWPLQAGSSESNGSGSITVLSGPAASPNPVTITSVSLVGSTLTLSGTNGVASITYHVLTTTNLSLPVTNWTVVTNGTYSGNGFSIPVTISTNDHQQFFSIKSP